MFPFLAKDSSSSDVDDVESGATAIAPPTVPRLTLKKVLYHPLTGLAIAAHLLLLIVPFNKPQVSPPDSETPEAEVDEAIPVDILNLSALSAPKAPAPTTQPPPPPVPAQAVSPDSVPIEVPPVEPVPVEPTPIEQATIEQPSAELTLIEQTPVEQTPAEQTPAEQTPVEQPLTYDPQADQQAFISQGLDALSKGTNAIGNFRAIGLPPINYFEKDNAANFLDYSSDPPSILAGAIDAVWMDKQAARVAEQIESTYGPKGVQLIPLSPYGDELLYEMLTPANETMMYVSLVNFPSKGSSLMVTWTVNPLGG